VIINKIPLHLKCVATLTCEILMSENWSDILNHVPLLRLTTIHMALWLCWSVAEIF